MENNAITIEVSINAPITKVWKYWTEPEHIKNWAFAADTWHAPKQQMIYAWAVNLAPQWLLKMVA